MVLQAKRLRKQELLASLLLHDLREPDEAYVPPVRRLATPGRVLRLRRQHHHPHQDRAGQLLHLFLERCPGVSVGIIERMTLEVRTEPHAVVFRVKVQPHAGRTAVLGEHAGMLKLAVTAPPEKGKANSQVIELLSRALGVSRSAVQILSGETSREKVVRIHGVKSEQILKMI